MNDEFGAARTNKKEFLEKMDRIIPWAVIISLVQPFYYKGERGNKPYPLELMLRIFILQNLYDLADNINKLVASETETLHQAQAALQKENIKLKEASELVTAMERVMGGTYVQYLLGEERLRRESDLRAIYGT